MEIDVYSRNDLSSGRRAELEEWFRSEFGHIPYQWANPDWYVLALMDSVLISRLSIVRHVVSVGEQPVPVGGIGGVITHPKWRGCKIASAALKKVVEFITSELNVEFILLLCRQKVAPVYARLGWKPVDGPTIFWQRGRKLTYPELTMILECGRKPWPAGPIDVCGLPW
jgi:GNAT superfamily N-acetyltransferase